MGANGKCTNLLVVGDLAGARRVAEEIREYASDAYRVVGCVTCDGSDHAAAGDLLGNVEALPRLIREHAIDDVLLLGGMAANSPKQLLDIVCFSAECRVRVHIVPGLYESLVGRLDLFEIGGIPLVELKHRPVVGGYAVLKRAMDIVCALLGLVLSSPILLAAAAAIKLDSRGPVFYRQSRCGLGGREFSIVKLRSMCQDAETESGPVHATKDDPRITRAGRLLRNRRIDEIPQLWNVLKGDMSLVGPRPERPYFVERITKDLPLFPLRLRVRPGITALSHVWGRYSSTPADRLRYDLVYINSISFLMDMRILFRTVKTVITGRGAQ